jgi:hypothetical protein
MYKTPLSGQIPYLGTSAETKVFWFFSSEKNKKKRLLFLKKKKQKDFCFLWCSGISRRRRLGG